MIEELYARQRGVGSRWTPATLDPLTTAVHLGWIDPAPPVGVYPVALQDPSGRFCADLEARPDARRLLGRYSVVVGSPDRLSVEGYSRAFAPIVGEIAGHLTTAAGIVRSSDATLADYLTAAAEGLQTDRWVDARRQWARMGRTASGWYVDVNPVRTDWEPCRRKAAFRFTFARAREPEGLVAQLGSMREEIDRAIADVTRGEYIPRAIPPRVADLLDVLAQSGRDHLAGGYEAGLSRDGRSVVVVNYESNVEIARSLVEVTRRLFQSAATPPVRPADAAFGAVLHELAHNTGPGPSDARPDGVRIRDALGPDAPLAEELKAHSATLFLVGFLRDRRVLRADEARWLYELVLRWVLEHAGSDGPSGDVAAILLDRVTESRALVWTPESTSADAEWRGSFVLDEGMLPAASEALLHDVVHLMLQGGSRSFSDWAAASATRDRELVQAVQERLGGLPQPSLLYSVTF